MDENKTEWIEPRHCTAYYDVSGGNVNYANEVQNALGVEFNIATSDLWIGKEGIGLEVEFTQQQCDLMFQSMNIMPHVTWIVTKGHKTKEIGPMITRLKGLPRQYVGQIQGQNLYRIKENKGNIWKQPRVDSMAIFEWINKLPCWEMLSMVEKENLLAQVPKELWTIHPNEVGRIKKNA